MPRVGASVSVAFLAFNVRGTVQSVDTDLHGVEVLTEEGDTLRFTLSPATGRFISDLDQGPRLLFEDRPPRADEHRPSADPLAED